MGPVAKVVYEDAENLESLLKVTIKTSEEYLW